MGNSEDKSDMNEVRPLYHTEDMEIHDVDIDTIKHLVNALAALQRAYNSTSNGFVADRCATAADTIRIALRQAGT